MLKKLLKSSLSFFFLFFFAGFIYIIGVQDTRLKAYETRNDTIEKKQIDISYNSPYTPTEEIADPKLETFLKCYQSEISFENFTEEMKKKYNEIEKLFVNSIETVSFSYEDLYSGLHISYNEKQSYFCASTIKSPVTTYIYKLYLEGEIDFNQKLTYEPIDYVEGSGVLRYQPIGSQYSIKSLVRDAIVKSDNVAYQILSRYINGYDIRNYWNDLGATTFWKNGIWGQVNSHDGAIYMKELYKLANDYPEIKDELLSMYFNSIFRLIQLDQQDIKIAHKSGTNGTITHDFGIVFSEQPYVLAITSTKGYSDYEDFFKQATKLVNEFHDLYWKQKSNYCYDKTFTN